jgi:hypothetical protein
LSIGLSLSPVSQARRNRPGTLATIGINDHHDATQEIHSGNDPALLTVRIGIFTSERVFILKHAHRIGKIDVMSA